MLLINKFPFFSPQILMLFSLFLNKSAQYWNQKNNTSDIVLFSTNQIADISYVRDHVKKKQKTTV